MADWLLTGAQLLVVGLAVAAALLVRPWRLIDWQARGPTLATPLLALTVVLPWLWSWPGVALPPGLRWSGAPLAVLLLGWPLAIPLLTLAGLSTLFTTDATLSQALGLTLGAGLVPATAMLVLGHGVRLVFGHHPVAYLMGRAFAVPLVVLALCGAVAMLVSGAAPAMPIEPDMQLVASLLLALGEASWTSAIVAILVACRPQWLATWSDAHMLGRRPAAQVPRT